MTAAPPPQDRAVPRSGWLLAHADGRVIVADPDFAALIGAPSPAALEGRRWPSLVTPRVQAQAAEAERAAAAGRSWTGRLEWLFADRPVEALVDLAIASAADGLVLLHATPIAPPDEAEEAPPSTDDAADLRALLAALEAAAQVADDAGAARAVLQALHPRLPFDWGAVLLLDGDRATVLCTYPAALAGVQTGTRWSPLDTAERETLASGEPSLAGDFVPAPGDSSPLVRLPAFGMRSVLRVPLYADGRVVGSVALYSHRRNAFRPADGLRLHRFAQPLGHRTTSASALPLPVLPATPGEPMVLPPTTAAGGVAEPSAEPPEAQAERLAAIGELVSGVAHELNNPLTAILGYAQILGSLDGAERAQAVATIEQQALRASRIVRNLLSFARQRRPRVESIDVNAVLRRVTEIRRYSLAMDNVELDLRLGELPPLLADEYQLEQVFLQLVNNAHQALQALQPPGGRITITSERAGDHARIAVTDTGPGIPDAIAPRVFDPFFTTREVGRGAGLGLAIVYGTVTEHGGSVRLERPAAGGARFVVELPLAGTPSAPDALAPLRGRGERILVVDDEPAIRVLAREVLNAAGYRTDVASSGEQALEQLGQGGYDMVIADVRMPGMDGVELFERIVERWPALQPRLIFITGDTEHERTGAMLRERGVHALEKPFHTAQLLRAVRDLLDRLAPDAPRTP